MFRKTLLLAATLTTCWAKSYMLAQDQLPIAFHRLSPSHMNVPSATLEEYTSPTLPCNTSPTLPCNGKGFYSDASDCTKFYRCIDVSSNNDFLQLVFKCHAGTIFSHEYESCIPGTCSNGPASAEGSAASVAAAALEASRTIAARSDEFVVPSIWQQDIHSRSTSREYGIMQCNSSVRFADPDNCEKYYDCVPSHNGGFVAHRRSCYGYAFHPTLKACVAPRMVKGCIISDSTRSLTIADPNLQKLCNNTNNAFLCADCKTLIICAEGNPYTETCDYGNVCSEKESFGGGVCYPAEPVECTCNRGDAFQQDFYNPSKFLSCDSEGTDPTVHSCPGGLEFNEHHRTCGTGIEETYPISGAAAVKDDCTRYFVFIFTTGGWVHKEVHCGKYTMFNEKTGKCEDPCDWYSDHPKMFSCKSEGRFANPEDCTMYYECIADSLNSNTFTCVEHECQEGYEWSQTDKSGVGLCVPSVTTKEKCVPTLRPSICKIPNEWCTEAVCSPNCINGVCTGHNICSCIPGWMGDLCQTSVCSPNCIHGDCTGPNICNCDPGWEGNLCQTYVCNPNCTNGKCEGPNICNCDPGWTGNICQTPMCSPNCVNGECTGPNICNCDPGWEGNLCKTYVCSPNCTNGECTGPNTCNCDPGWTGNICQTHVCNPNCNNGECKGPNTCQCDIGWAGNLCETAVCSQNCINGLCTGPNICSCILGWTGNICQTPVCSWNCNNGECTGPNICSCEPGWTGNLCQTHMCSPNCTNGECTGPNTCNCESGWTGNLCQTSLCNPNCINGECSGTNTCNCEQGWTGNLCQNPVCIQNCINGVCTGPNICSCIQGWAGNLCQDHVCSPNCSNGECTGPNICKCDPGWTGNLCQNKTTLVDGEQSARDSTFMLKDTVGCSEAEGFTMSSGSNQCFKVFKDMPRSWAEANTKCKSEGLRLAEPIDDVAIRLREDLLDKYGDDNMWVGAKGNGSDIRWQSKSEVIPSDSPLRWPNQGMIEGYHGRNMCLSLLVDNSHLNAYPTRPYFVYTCQSGNYYTLCELVSE